ncbi:EAD6 domain-containing conflict system protein [Okeania sp. SIO2C2]|uniref:EAD6 domain-containing conflict system protein n=1 Tax=Okeania sp. SIO2C2 TaxID=2607787 RepID=UPI00257AA7B2|nr:EAD6 domain-containing conflict system protein [Okeania sp. SIO2C2]
MNLTDAQKGKLCEKIEEVLKEDSLKNIFIQYRDTFGNNFYNKISGGDYHTKSVNLIEELINREFIDDFIKIVSKDYPSIKALYEISIRLYPLVYLIKKIFQKNNKYVKHLMNFDSIDSLEDYLLNLIDNKNNNPLLNYIGNNSRKHFSF